MNDELRLIQYLYGEAEAPASLEHDDALRDEYEQMRCVRDALDARPAVCPSAGVLDRVVAGASASADQGRHEDGSPGRNANELPGASPRRDRSAVPPRSQRWTRLLSVGGALAVVLLLVIVGHEQIVKDPAAQQRATQERAVQEHGGAERAAQQESAAPRDAAPSRTEREAEPALAAGAEVSADEDVPVDAAPVPSASEVSEELLAWDAPQGEVFEVYRRVQVLQARSRSEGLHPAGTRRTLYD